jgi:hypothetical protein
MRVEQVYRQSLQMAHFVANRAISLIEVTPDSSLHRFLAPFVAGDFFVVLAAVTRGFDLDSDFAGAL